MKKAWLWIKDHALWILGGLAAFLGALLALKYEREKIDKLKDKASVATATKEIGELRAKQEVLEKVEKGLEKRDDAVGKQIEDIEEQRAEVRRKTKGMSDKQVAARFRAMYSFSKKDKKNGKTK